MVSSMMKKLHHHIKLLVIRRILLFYLIKFLTKVGNLIFCPRTMFENESVVLEEFNPLNMSFTQIMLGIKESKGLMVRIKDKLLW